MKDAYYFSHDANARHDLKILLLRAEFGAAGYAWYFMILEMMREAHNYRLPLSFLSQSIAIGLGESIEQVNPFLEKCCALKLFIKDEKTIFSESLLRRMDRKENLSISRRSAGRLGAMARWQNSKIAKWQTDGKPMAVKERKGKERKEKKENKESVSLESPPYEEKTPEGIMICDFKMVLKIDRHDRDWDRVNYSRHLPAVQDILKAFYQDFVYARDFLINESISMRDWAEREGKAWTINAIARKAWNRRGQYLEEKAAKEKTENDNRNTKEAMGFGHVLERNGVSGAAHVGKLAAVFLERKKSSSGGSMVKPAGGQTFDEPL